MRHLAFTSTSESDTIDLGERLAAVLRPGDALTLEGPLGAGKTRLVRGVARAFACDEALVASPTYVIVHHYTPRSPLRPPLVHMDAYRLSSPDDLDSIGWDRLADGSSVLLIEWGQKIAGALDSLPSVARLTITPAGTEQRLLRLVAPESWGDRPEWNRLAAHADESTDDRARGTPMPAGGGAGGGRDAWTRCPVCALPVAPHAREFPFCTERCRMADLGKWFSGAYSVSRELAEDDLNDPDLTPPQPPPTTPSR